MNKLCREQPHMMHSVAKILNKNRPAFYWEETGKDNYLIASVASRLPLGFHQRQEFYTLLSQVRLCSTPDELHRHRRSHL
jgi:hypothetical protein